MSFFIFKIILGYQHQKIIFTKMVERRTILVLFEMRSVLKRQKSKMKKYVEYLEDRGYLSKFYVDLLHWSARELCCLKLFPLFPIIKCNKNINIAHNT